MSRETGGSSSAVSSNPRFAIGFHAEVAADLGEGDLDRPATNEPAEDVERLRIEIGAEECLGLALTRRVTDQDVADGDTVAGLGPDGGAGDDLERLFAAAVPSAHPQAAPSCPRVVEALLERELAGPDQARPPALAGRARWGRIAERGVEPQAGDHGDPVPHGLKQFDSGEAGVGDGYDAPVRQPVRRLEQPLPGPVGQRLERALARSVRLPVPL